MKFFDKKTEEEIRQSGITAVTYGLIGRYIKWAAFTKKAEEVISMMPVCALREILEENALPTTVLEAIEKHQS